MPTFQNDQWQEALVSIANTGIATTPPTDIVSTTGSPITADQGVVSANFGAGVASWSTEATGTFSAGTTLFFEFQLTGSGSWYPAFGVPIGSTSDVAVSSVVGGASVTYQGNAAGFQAFRVRAHPFAGGDSVTVKIVGSLATDGGFVSKSLPPGTNSIGSVTANGGTNLNTSLLALESGGNLATLVTNTADLLADGDHLATIDSGIASLITNTADLLADGDNLATINTNTANIPAKGSTTKANSTPVTIATDDTLLTNTTGLATQTTLASVQTNTANIPAKGSATSANSTPVVIASDQANVPVKGGFTEVAGVTTISASASSTGATTVAAADFIVQLDVSAYKFLGLQLSGTWAGTFTFQCSNDNATWVSLNLTSPVPSSTGYSFQTTINGMFLGPVCFRYFRVRCTTFASNASLGGVLELYTQAPPLLNSFAQIAGTWTVQPGNTQNTTPWLMAGPNANGTQAANSAANTVIKGSAGWLYHAIITTLGTAGLTIYDNATTNSGTPLLVIPASAAVGTIYSFPSGARAVNGITSAGVTNCPAVTFHYT